jgi:hypothetical protein
MSRSRQKGTEGENFFLPRLRRLFGAQVMRLDEVARHLRATDGDYVGVPWHHEAKNTERPLFQKWARVAEKKQPDGRWVVMWKGDLRVKTGNGPYVLMPLSFYEELVEHHPSSEAHGTVPRNVVYVDFPKKEIVDL